MSRPSVSRVTVLAATVLLSSAVSRAAAEPVPLSGDTYTEAAAPEARHGSKLFLRVSESTASFVRFDLSAIPVGSTVASATLTVFVGRLGTPGTLSLHTVDAAWTEDDLNHVRRPGWGAEPVATLPISSTTPLTEYVPIDVTDAVQAWVNGVPNHGFVAVGSGGVDVDLLSKEFMPDSRPVTLDVVAIAPRPAQ